MKKKEEPLKEVWALIVHERAETYGDTECLRVFANMGEREITLIAEEIAQRYDSFCTAIERYVADFLKDELAKGETEIHIDENEEEFGGEEYIIAKYKLDSGCDWMGNQYEVEPDETTEVYVGSEVYFSVNYALYSCEGDRGMDELTVE